MKNYELYETIYMKQTYKTDKFIKTECRLGGVGVAKTWREVRMGSPFGVRKMFWN